MLVLSRQRDQEIIFGADVTISIVDVRGDKVRLGIVASSNFQVYRKELYDEILQEIRSGKTPPLARTGKGGKLVLSRQRGEKIVIMAGGDWYNLYCEVQIVDIRGDKVRLGCVAGKAISVHRKEVYDEIKREGRDPTVAMPETATVDADDVRQAC